MWYADPTPATAAAFLLPRGKAAGVQSWHTEDRSQTHTEPASWFRCAWSLSSKSLCIVQSFQVSWSLTAILFSCGVWLLEENLTCRIFRLLLQIYFTPLLPVLCLMRLNCFDCDNKYPHLRLPGGSGQRAAPGGDQRDKGSGVRPRYSFLWTPPFGVTGAWPCPLAEVQSSCRVVSLHRVSLPLLITTPPCRPSVLRVIVVPHW